MIIPIRDCKRYLLTSVINSNAKPGRNYNTAHKKTRNILERCFGVWKQRFPCFRRKLSTKLETTISVNCALALLHNITRQEQDDIGEVYNEDNNNAEENVNLTEDNPNSL